MKNFKELDINKIDELVMKIKKLNRKIESINNVLDNTWGQPKSISVRIGFSNGRTFDDDIDETIELSRSTYNEALKIEKTNLESKLYETHLELEAETSMG